MRIVPVRGRLQEGPWGYLSPFRAELFLPPVAMQDWMPWEVLSVACPSPLGLGFSPWPPLDLG